MSTPKVSPQSVGVEADRAALERTGRALLILAAGVAIVGFVLGYTAQLGILASVLIAIALGLSIVVIFFWTGRAYLIGAARDARSAEDVARQDASVNRVEADRLRPFESMAKTQTAELADLRADVQRLKESLSQAQAENERLRIRADSVESRARTLELNNQALNLELTNERNSTARAPFMPELSPRVELSGLGILGPRSIRIRTENIGRGNALRIQVSALLINTGRPDQLVQVEYIPTLVPRHHHYSVVGDVNQLAGVTAVEAQLQYESQFGRCPPIGVRTVLPI